LQTLHDHHVRSFSVDANAKTLRLGTAWPHAAGPAFAEGVFEGVEAYVMVGDALGTIIFDVEEVDPVSLYEEFGASMRLTYERSGGHAPWVRAVDTAREFLNARSIKGYAVNSSIGLTGAVWAEGYRARWSVAPSETPHA
jgi:hypothetical protein